MTKIEYEDPVVKKFIEELDAALSSSSPSKTQFTNIWEDLQKNIQLPTVYVTLLIGSLIYIENSKKDKEPSIQQVINEFKLGSHQETKEHPILNENYFEENIGRRKSSADQVETVHDFLAFAGNKTQADYFTTLMMVSMEYTILREDPSFLHILDLAFNTFEPSIFAPDPLPTPPLLHAPLAYSILPNEETASLSFLPEAADKIGHNVVFELLTLVMPTSMSERIRRMFQFVLLTHDAPVEASSITAATDVHSPASFAPGMVLSALQKLCSQHGVDSLQIISNTISSLQKERTSTSTASSRSLLRALKLLNHLQSFIYIPPTSDVVLMKFIRDMKPFFIHPKPLGTVARDILQTASSESWAPGYAMRHRLMDSATVYQFEDGTFRLVPRRVHLMLNQEAFQTSQFLNRFDFSSNHSKHAQELNQAQANLLLNIFECFNLSDAKLERIPANGLALAFPEANDILESEIFKKKNNQNKQDIIVNISSEEDNPIVQKLLDLKERILSSPASSKTQGPGLRRLKVPEIPKPIVNMIEMPEEENMTDCPRWGTIYMRNAWFDKLEEVCRQEVKTAESESKSVTNQIPVDVAIAGGTASVGHFVNGYFMLLKKEAEMMKKINLRVFLVPLGKVNVLSSHLEKFDPLFSVAQHCPVLSNRDIIPSLPLRSGNKKQKDPDLELPTGCLTPHRYWGRILEEYFRDAHGLLPTHIVYCECLYNESSKLTDSKKSGERATKTKSYIRIPFCQEAEISSISHALFLKEFQKKKAFKKLSVEEIEHHKSFKYTGSNVTISYTPTDASGNQCGYEIKLSEDPRTYSTIRIRSVSRFGHTGALVGPQNGWFEVTVEEYDPKKKNKRLKQVDNSDHFCAYKLNIVAQDDVFVIFDGELYGPCRKLMFSAEQPDTDVARAFDVKTFSHF
eukprot:gb/GECH01001400.1/.p1 GENE.gb/GECH01001400.1/~~gb/GECH01001400.1/.p1  ORF type:complete len:912 (+),score=239.03 gb/GECH01001400.1/:1-2736(+)